MAVYQHTIMVPKIETLCGHYLKDKEGKRYFLSIERDPGPESPRTSMSNLTHMICWHSRYSLGDGHNFADMDGLTDWLKEQEDSGDEVYCRPLFLLDHGYLSISVQDFNDRWDSGCVGMVYALRSELVKAGFDFTSVSWRNVAKGIVEDEVEYYDQYLSGEVYGYRLYEMEGNDLNEVDSCWGFYGDDPRTNGMLDSLAYMEVIDYEEV